MRQYRGLTKDSVWVYGYHCYVQRNHYIILQDAFRRENGIYSYRKVIPETVGQQTGLKDKNGKEIYEGDIVTIKRLDNNVEEKAVITWSDNDCSFCYSVGERGCVYRVTLNMKPEIIGDIHTTPKLMEAKDE